MLVFAFGVSPFMIIQLKDFNDGFGIRNELFFISFMAVPCALCYFLIPPLDFRFSQVYLDKTTFMALLIITSHITSTIIPLYRHYKANKKPCPYTAWIMQRRALRKDKNRVEVLNGDAHPDDSYSSTTPVSPKLRDIKHNDNPQRNYTGRPASDVFQTLGDHVLSKNSTMDSNGQVGGGINMKSVSSKKADWEGFIRVLEDQKLFKKMSAFTVREFCAENTRFLYEVSRLERRARQYEHLRDLATNIDQQQQQQETAESNATSPRVSVIAPLPNQFSTAPPRIKKIISASSMSSTVPILQRTPSTEYDSEPSSPLGSSRSNFQTSSGSSSNTVSPSDLEQGTASVITEQKPRPSKISTSTPSFDPLPMPPTLLIQFEYIYKTFIVVGSRLELNLSHDTLQQIHRMARRGEWRSGMFDSAIFEIQELLFRDVWPKFVTSSQGLNYNGVKPTPESIQLQEVGVVNEQYARGVASSVSRVSLFMSSVPTSPVERSTPVMPSLPNAALPRTTTKTMPGPIQDIGMEGGFSLNMVDRSGSRTSVKTQGRNCNKDDAFNEELTQTGFKTWLRKTSRKGITAAAMISREGNNEESLGIIEQSRKSMGNRRSDISGLYSQSIQNSLANSGGGGGGGGGGY
ncbi:hypothetical protein BGZ46_010309 [Entomortierella lignicola]|nr:hypothetical protein BGZ46_010309 [Entomortierella lignicola]